MKVFIIGVTGETGFRLATLLKARGDEVEGLYRRPAQASRLAGIGVGGAPGDIARIEADALAGLVRGADVIVFTAGAGEADDDSMIDAVDGAGVDKTIAAAGRAGVRRVILVSVFPEAGRGQDFGEGFEHYIEVKKHADVALARSGLDWVILRPSSLTNDAGVGAVSLGAAEIHTVVSRDDVAAVLAELVHTPALRRRILELTEGSTPIAAAVVQQRED